MRVLKLRHLMSGLRFLQQDFPASWSFIKIFLFRSATLSWTRTVFSAFRRKVFVIS
jgi:hypothetical protein